MLDADEEGWGCYLFGRHEARYCLVISGWRWYDGMQTSCSQSASFTSNNVAQQSGNGECLFTTISYNPSEYSSGSRSNSSLIFTILTTRMRGEISCKYLELCKSCCRHNKANKQSEKEQRAKEGKPRAKVAVDGLVHISDFAAQRAQQHFTVRFQNNRKQRQIH